MSETTDVCIDLEAAKTLVHWKSLFADEVVAGAMRLAATSGKPGTVTVSHYRQAAEAAIRSLSAAILGDGPPDEYKEAA